MPRSDWFTGCSLVTAPISQPHCPLKCALGLGVGSNMAFTFNNLYPDRVEGLERQVDRGEPPITCQHCQGQCLIIPSLLASIHVIYHSHHLFFGAHIRERDKVWRGYTGMYKYVENWISMDSFARADLFVWWQTEVAFVYLPAGPRLSPSMAHHSGDKHQLAAHSTDTTTSSQSQQITF